MRGKLRCVCCWEWSGVGGRGGGEEASSSTTQQKGKEGCFGYLRRVHDGSKQVHGNTRKYVQTKSHMWGMNGWGGAVRESWGSYSPKRMLQKKDKTSRAQKTRREREERRGQPQSGPPSLFPALRKHAGNGVRVGPGVGSRARGLARQCPRWLQCTQRPRAQPGPTTHRPQGPQGPLESAKGWQVHTRASQGLQGLQGGVQGGVQG